MRLLSWIVGPKARIPDPEAIYAIGDIHGRDDLLGRLHEIIEADIAAAPPGRQATVVHLGDYVDRGPDSKAVIDRLINRPLRGARSVFLKGNHEDAMLQFLAGNEGAENWLSIGGGATVQSYGVAQLSGGNRSLPSDVIRGRLARAIPPEHLAFLRGLALLHQVGDYLFVHAGIRPGRPIEEQDPKDLMWIRREFLTSRRHHGKFVVHGHAAGNGVVVKRNRICVDTKAYATDRLSCIVLEADSRRFLSADL
jgi:serine/threonine protein phosphatase 1